MGLFGNMISFCRLAFVFSAFALAAGIHAADATSQQTPPSQTPAKSSGFLNSLGGILHQQLATQTNSTNRTIESLRSLDAMLSNTNSPTFQSTNTSSLVNRLGSMLGGNTTAGTNTVAGTNLVQKMKDWLDAQHSAGTNAAASTNALAQRSWATLTNWLAMHAKTNASSSAADGSTNLVQKVRDWARQELQTHTNATDTMNPKLAALANLFQSSTNTSGWTTATTLSTNALNALTSLKTNAPTAVELEETARRDAATGGGAAIITNYERLDRRERLRKRAK
jgi:hypothetical protein